MKKITKILVLSLSATALFACDDIVAKPGNVLDDNNLVNFGDGNNNYYDNNFEVIYDQLIDAGTSNETILEAITSEIAIMEVSKFYGISTELFNQVLDNVNKVLAGKEKVEYASNKEVCEKLETIILEDVKDKMVEKAKTGTYSVDSLFQEKKFVDELKTSLYKIENDTSLTVDYLITPDSTYEDIFTADYSDYITKEIYPDLLKTLLTSIYLYNRQYATIGRSYAREATYIKLENISTHLDAVPVLINSYFEAFANGTTPTGDFDLNSLARIYKGVYSEEEIADHESVAYKEYKFIEDNGIFTKEAEIQEQISKVGTYNEETKEYDFLDDNDPNKDESLVTDYTGSYKYPVSWGKTLKERSLESSEVVVDDGLVVKSGGLTNLPSGMRDRLFASSVVNYTKKIESNDKSDSFTILTPKVTPNDNVSKDPSSQYAYYDSSTNAYYIVVFENYYNTTILKNGQDGAENFSQETKDKALEIARILGTSSNNQTNAVTYYLDYYDLQFGDQNFYDYIESTYPSVFDDEYSYKN